MHALDYEDPGLTVSILPNGKQIGEAPILQLAMGVTVLKMNADIGNSIFLTKVQMHSG